jgi:formylglycine-generating enzyme required for sulfatase activity
MRGPAWNALVAAYPEAKDVPEGDTARFMKAIGGGAKPFTDPATAMEFLPVAGGCFQMGDTFGDGDKDEKPVHEVCVNDFSMAKYDVTVGDFRRFVTASGYTTEAEKKDGCAVWNGSKWEYGASNNWRNPGFDQDERHPVVCVSWNDAQAYVQWQAKESGKAYRLPTEAEWEYAARSGGKKYKYSWGNDAPSGNIADESAKRQFPTWVVWNGYDDGYVYTSPVGTYKPNELGLYDMTGNAWQWLNDWYGEKYYDESSRNNPKGPATGERKVLRGGSWFGVPRFVRASVRFRSDPANRFTNLGFRLVFPAEDSRILPTEPGFHGSRAGER